MVELAFIPAVAPAPRAVALTPHWPQFAQKEPPPESASPVKGPATHVPTDEKRGGLLDFYA